MKADHRFAVIIDTNVWISAALSRTVPPAALVRFVLDHALPVFSEATFSELETRLWKPKFDRYLSMEVRRNLLQDLRAASEWVKIPATLASVAYSRDSDDDMFIHAALTVGAPWLISGDQDLLSVKPVSGLRILKPSLALSLPAFALNND